MTVGGDDRMNFVPTTAALHMAFLWRGRAEPEPPAGAVQWSDTFTTFSTCCAYIIVVPAFLVTTGDQSDM